MMRNVGKTSVRVWVAITVSMGLWASAFAAIKSAGREFSACDLALFRFMAATVVLAIFAAVKRVRVPGRKDILPFLVTGFLGITLYHPFLNYGEQVESAGVASLLINSALAWTAALAVIFLRERVSWKKAAGMMVSFAGIALSALAGEKHLSVQPAALFIVGSAICTSIYVIVQKKYLADWGALDFTFWTILAGTILLMPLFVVSTVGSVTRASPRAIGEVLYLGIFPGALAYAAFAYATVRLPAARVMSFMYLVPPAAMLMAWLYLGEVPGWLSLVGGGLAIGGVAMVNAAEEKRAPVVAVEEA